MYRAKTIRYSRMKYRRAGRSGLLMPELSLGIWHNWGLYSDYDVMKDMMFTAFDNGITHIDAANNYGPPPGSAEENLGKILSCELAGYRDELLISTKAGYEMWPGPYGNWGGRKYLMASLDRSLERLHLDYVDIFYHHRPDPDTPLEETVGALADMVRSGKTIYVGFSNYPAELLWKATAMMEEKYSIHPVLDQVRYSIVDRHIEEDGLLQAVADLGMSVSVFSPLAQGLLTDKYLMGDIPDNSRAKENRFLKEETITSQLVARLNVLNEIAEARGETLSEMAISFILRRPEVATVIIGARNSEQIRANLNALGKSREFSDEEILEITGLF